MLPSLAIPLFFTPTAGDPSKLEPGVAVLRAHEGLQSAAMALEGCTTPEQRRREGRDSPCIHTLTLLLVKRGFLASLSKA